MSMTDDRYMQFFLTAPRRVKRLELVEVSHPNFTETFRIVRNLRAGVSATVDGEPQDFQFYPLRIRQDATSSDLGQGLTVDIGDLGDLVPVQLDAVAAADGNAVKPTLRYWAFRSDDMVDPILGPFEYEVKTIAFTAEGASIRAGAPTADQSRTGEALTLERFPTQRGLL